MIKNIIALTKVFIKTSLTNFQSNSKKSSNILRYLLYAFLVVYVIGTFSFLSIEIIDLLLSINQENVFIGYAVTICFFLMLITAIFSTISIFYFSKDNISVLPLPLKPMEVLASKLNTLLAYEYLEEAAILLGPMIVFGIKTNQNFVYYILLLLMLLIMPIIPLIIGCFIIMLIMSFTKGIRNKNIVQIITMLLSICFAMSISLFSSRASTSEDPYALINSANGLVTMFERYFFTIGLSIKVLIDKNIISLLILILISLAAYILLIMFSQKLYYKGMLGSLFSSSGISNKKLDETKAYKSNGLLSSYVLKEIRVYLRKPVYLMQLILPCVVMPVLMLIITYSGFKSGYGGDVKELLNTAYLDPTFEDMIYFVFLAIVLFTTMYSFVSNVAISKDGSDASFMKYIPVPFYKQVIYKMVPDILINLTSFILISITAVILLAFPIKYILISLFVVLPYCICHGALIIFDLVKPKLNWLNEMQVVKNNFRFIYSIAFALLNIGLIVVLHFLLHLEKVMLTISLSAIYSFVGIFALYFIYKKDIKLAKNIY